MCGLISWLGKAVATPTAWINVLEVRRSAPKVLDSASSSPSPTLGKQPCI